MRSCARFRPALLVLAILGLLAASATAETNSSGSAPDGRTGAPGEGLCTDCHGSSAGNGSFDLLGVPTLYQAGETYSITVRLQDPGQQRWGFELTVIDGDSDAAGTIAVTDAVNTQLSDNAGTNPDYVKHTSTGTYNGTPDGPVTWQFDWTAPDPAVGEVTFYAAGNAANGNGSTSGDFIYTTSKSLTEGEIAVPLFGDTGLLILLTLLIGGGMWVLIRRSPATA